MSVYRGIRFSSILLLLALITQACSFPQLPTAYTQTAEPPTQASNQQQPEAEVSFHVQVPPDTPVGEHIYLSVLDEVTGLALNAQQNEMKAIDDYNFKLTLTFPIGSIVKYRYSRKGTYLSDEHISNKRPVRYRMYSVDGPSTIQDIVSVWSDTAMTGTSGRIIGHVLDANTEAPIPSILINAGGATTFSAFDGSFLIEGLPPGTHNLIAYSMDGSYHIFQQGARVAAESSTPAEIHLSPAKLVKVNFDVAVPPGTMPAIPIRMAGDISQLGNTFADLAGGVSMLASRMPVLNPLPDGHYQLKMSLPTGMAITYKYTLGDGFWNAEHTKSGDFKLRHLIVPSSDTVIHDVVDSWGSYTAGPILFNVQIPSSTPLRDYISIQFNPYSWTEPIPMWSLDSQHWAYVLYSPLDLFQRIGYRYCRNDQCGSADDSATPGNESYGRILEISPGAKTVKDQVEAWNWYQGSLPPATVSDSSIRARGPDFFAGVELQPNFDPSWTPNQDRTFQDIQSMGANWVILTPSWSFTRLIPPTLELVAGSDPLLADTTSAIHQAQEHSLQVAIFPDAHFVIDQTEWWTTAPRDFAWWVTWFDRYRSFILTYADLAQKYGAKALIIGGEWIAPALPDGTLPNGQPSGVPADAAQRWRDVIRDVRSRYQGSLMWALPLDDGLPTYPGFIDTLDDIYLLWSVRLADRNDAQEPELNASIARYLDDNIQPLQADLAKPIIIAVSYPSADGGVTDCLPDPLSEIENACLNIEKLARPNADISSVSIDLTEQADVYNAMLVAINERDYIDGIVTRGFYPPAILQDKSTSVHGKPAGNVLWYWFPRLLGTVNP